jgi:hypothetical protein
MISSLHYLDAMFTPFHAQNAAFGLQRPAKRKYGQITE